MITLLCSLTSVQLLYACRNISAWQYSVFVDQTWAVSRAQPDGHERQAARPET